MNLRRLLPARLRWRFARRWITHAEAAEQMHTLTSKDIYARNAMEHYLRAVKWYPPESVLAVPPPDNLGAHVVDEQLWPEALSAGDKYPKGWKQVPCILCGTPIPQARKGQGATEGKYCSRCRED